MSRAPRARRRRVGRTCPSSRPSARALGCSARWRAFRSDVPGPRRAACSCSGGAQGPALRPGSQPRQGLLPPTCCSGSRRRLVSTSTGPRSSNARPAGLQRAKRVATRPRVRRRRGGNRSQRGSVPARTRDAPRPTRHHPQPSPRRLSRRRLRPEATGGSGSPGEGRTGPATRPSGPGPSCVGYSPDDHGQMDYESPILNHDAPTNDGGRSRHVRNVHSEWPEWVVRQDFACVHVQAPRVAAGVEAAAKRGRLEGRAGRRSGGVPGGRVRAGLKERFSRRLLWDR